MYVIIWFYYKNYKNRYYAILYLIIVRIAEEELLSYLIYLLH